MQPATNYELKARVRILELENELTKLRESCQPLYDRLADSYDPDDDLNGLGNELFLAKQALAKIETKG